jgi:hypothetical protein
LDGLLCCLALATAAWITPASSAYAGTLTIDSCSLPGGEPAPTEGWSTGAIGGLGPYSGDVDSCPEHGALIARSSAEGPQPAYNGPDWIYTAPGWASEITGGTITASLTSPHGQTWLGTPNQTYDSADVFANCQYNDPCGQAGTMTGTFAIAHPGGTHIYAIALCVAETTCPATSSGVDASVSVSAAAIELANDSTPAGSGFAGGLLGPGARGTQELLFDASDPQGPGVYAVTVQVDGTDLYNGIPDSNGGACAALGVSNGGLVFDHAQPCRQSESVDLPIDTATLLDGQHNLKVTVQDAAGNTSVVYATPITTNNAPVETTAPTIAAPAQATVGNALNAQPGGWSAPAGAGTITYSYQWQDCDSQGEDCQAITAAKNASYTPAVSDAGHTVRVLVTASDNDGSSTLASAATSTIAAPGSPGSPPPGGSATPDTPNGNPASESALLHLDRTALKRSFAKRAFKLTGHLTNKQSQPIAGATLEVLQRIQGSDTLLPVADIQTGPTGAFSVQVPAGPSRLIEVAYQAFADDASYTATATARETVRAGVQLKTSKPATTPTGTVIFSGKVQGPIPSQGALVQLLVKFHGEWELIRNPRTKANGSFHLSYQFQGSIGRFPFRIEIPAGQTSFPYACGYSNTIEITTYPSAAKGLKGSQG